MIKKISPLPEFLVTRYKKWKSSLYIKNANKFKKLASLGQKPSSMIISCCDSRIHATSIFDADVGEFFIHRNIANLIPPFAPDLENHGTSAALEYAIKELKVKHLIILGHTSCGGIINAHKFHSGNFKKDYKFINKWLSILLPAFNNIEKNVEEKNQIKQLGEESIKVSINNLFSFSFIKEAVEKNKLTIHGLIHDIGSGKLKSLNELTNEFENL